mgnify:CR=1 FL=1
MLPLHDTQVRLVLLGHVTTRLAEARPLVLERLEGQDLARAAQSLLA